MSGFWRTLKYSSFVVPAGGRYFAPQFPLDLVVSGMKVLSGCLLALVATANAVSSADQLVSVSHGPLVMRLSKDEFRIAFGLNGERCAASGCHGVIRYRVSWKTEEGTTTSETRRVSFTVAPRTARSIIVDRQFFDTAEGAHTTDITGVRVDEVTCAVGTVARAL